MTRYWRVLNVIKYMYIEDLPRVAKNRQQFPASDAAA